VRASPKETSCAIEPDTGIEPDSGILAPRHRVSSIGKNPNLDRDSIIAGLLLTCTETRGKQLTN
jgi:hypothetical protein